jgi:hypothetical protein
MRCNLPFGAKTGATVTLYNTFIRLDDTCNIQLENALRRRVNLHFLLIYPYAITEHMRMAEFSKEKTYNEDTYRQSIVASLRMIRQARIKVKDDVDIDPDTYLKVKLYDSLPNMPIYRLDNNKGGNVIYQGFFLPVDNGSNDMPALEIKPTRAFDGRCHQKSSGTQPDFHALYEPLWCYVEDKWNDSVALNFEGLSGCLGDKDSDNRWLECLQEQLMPSKADDYSGAVKTLIDNSLSR